MLTLYIVLQTIGFHFSPSMLALIALAMITLKWVRWNIYDMSFVWMFLLINAAALVMGVL